MAVYKLLSAFSLIVVKLINPHKTKEQASKPALYITKKLEIEKNRVSIT